MAKTIVKRNPRLLNWRQQFQPQLIVFNAPTGEVGGTTLSLFQPNIAGVFESLPLFGGLAIPQWTLQRPGGAPDVMPSAIEYADDNTTVILTYPTLTAGGYALLIPPYTPELRNAQGGWVAPAYFQFTLEAP